MGNLHRFFYYFFLLVVATSARGFSISDDAKKQRAADKFSPMPNLVNQNFFKKCDPCPEGIKCVPTIQCPAHVRMKVASKPQICDLPHGGHGFCCTTGNRFSAPKDSKFSNEAAKGRSANENESTLRDIVEATRSRFSSMLSQEFLTATVTTDQPEFMHNLAFHSSPQSELRSIDLSHKAMEQVLASQILKERDDVAQEDFELGEVHAFLEGTPLQSTCEQRPICPAETSRYRTQDGTCNNPEPTRSSWGSAGSPMERLLPPSYKDGIWDARTLSVDGTPLSPARAISNFLLQDVDRPHPRLNLLFMQMGQFITHDVSQSSSIKTAEGKSVRCCSEDGSSVLPQEMLHFACFPIEIDAQDNFYSDFHQGCINFVRSSLSPDAECKLGYGKQLSKVSHFLDGSAIYGSDLKTQAEVRSLEGGRLSMLDDFGRELLPLSMDKDACGSLDKGPCFFAGDGRANQLISLTALHIMFAREHNRIADILNALNPSWTDDVIFYETQRIVVAELQHIVYSEWLPELIGSDTMHRFGLHIRENGYSNDYDPEVNPAITSEFSTAAQRFGHSVVDGKLLIHKGAEINEIIDIPDVMFNAGRLRQRHFYDEVLLTLTRQSLQEVDSAITQGLSRYLFRGNNPFGLDLAAINIQRGRDHAIRPYNDYVEVSGHRRIASFDEFGPDLGPKLAAVYHHPDDIDLWIGGLLESARDNGLIGPTFADIIADQFSKLRKGDRYFYEHGPDTNPGAFTPEQLQEIKKTSISRLICDNSDSIQGGSPNGFVRPDVPGNSLVTCGQLPAVNFLPWRSL